MVERRVGSWLICCALVTFAGSPGQAVDRPMGPLARQEVRIVVSVRPTMRVQRLPGHRMDDAAGGQAQFCVWSNTSDRRYDVRFEFPLDNRSQPSSGRTTNLDRDQSAAIANDGEHWARDQVAAPFGSSCTAPRSGLTPFMASFDADPRRHPDGAVTIIVVPR